MYIRRVKTIMLAFALLLAACSKGLDNDLKEDDSFGDDVGHEMIELGRQLEDPYSVKNITKAIASLYPTRAAREDITPTDKYVRFLPETEEELDRLHSLGIDLLDHPLDYQIVKDGDFYHDPRLPEDVITWQYAVVPDDFEFPSGIRCEILDECYIPSADTKSDGLDWEAIERESFRLTGNGDMLSPQTKGGRSRPKGRICIVDEEANNGKPFGVAGVRVVCNSFVKFSADYTDRDGYYEIPKKFSSRPRYRLMFLNKEGFAIGVNLLLVRASMSALGKASNEGMDYTITSSSNRKLFCRSVVNNAAYDYIQRCKEDDLDILSPPKNLRIWIFQKLSAGCSPMLRHGTVLDQGIFAKYLGEYAKLIKIFLPDIALGLKKADSYSEIYNLACHQLAHASHYTSVGNSWWNDYIKYVVVSLAETLDTSYGSGNGDGAGQCAVAEMWAYFVQDYLYHDRYGGEMQLSGLSYWFRPQIFKYLYERGFTVSQIFSALAGSVGDVDDLKTRLESNFPENAEMIEQIFSRYAQ